MAAGVYDFDMHQGADFRHSVEVTDTAGDAIDITGATIVMQMRPSIRSSTKLFDIGTSSGEITIPTGTDGIMDIVIDDATTAAINQSGFYDLQITYSSGEAETLLRGRINLIPEVTR